MIAIRYSILSHLLNHVLRSQQINDLSD